MKIGWIGLGKLGLPCAVATAMRGHEVVGFDLDPHRMSYAPQPYRETGPNGKDDFNEWLAMCEAAPNRHIKGSLRFGDVAEVCAADLVFVAVQTPHDPRFEGITPLPDERADFDYSWLKAACRQLVGHLRQDQTVAVISTALPGTMRREIFPILAPYCHVAYNPSFIAMGTTMRDFLDPEFVLVGAQDEVAGEMMHAFWSRTVDAPVRRMAIESAELAKVAYNTAISTKIAVANTVLELCEAIPEADVDDVTGAMKAAYRRITGPAYMDGGMGDGGGCHPRDNIAMSWLAKEKGLSHNLFDDIMRCRDDQAEWLAGMVMVYAEAMSLPMTIYGYAYKPNSAITTGSPALLVAEFIKRAGRDVELHDPVVDPAQGLPDAPRVILVGCKHDHVSNLIWPPGSVVIDPFRVTRECPDVKTIRLGAGRS